MENHRHACTLTYMRRPHSLVDGKMCSAFTCVLDFLLGWEWCKAIRWLFWSKFHERSAKAHGACCKVPRIGSKTERHSKRKWNARMRVTAFGSRCKRGCWACERNRGGNNGSTAHAANKRARQWSRESFVFLARNCAFRKQHLDQPPSGKPCLPKFAQGPSMFLFSGFHTAWWSSSQFLGGSTFRVS